MHYGRSGRRSGGRSCSTACLWWESSKLSSRWDEQKTLFCNLQGVVENGSGVCNVVIMAEGVGVELVLQLV